MNYTDDQKAILKGFGLTDAEIAELETDAVPFEDAEKRFRAVVEKAQADAAEALRTQKLADQEAALHKRTVETAGANAQKAAQTRAAMVGVDRIDSGSRPEVYDKAAAIGLVEKDFQCYVPEHRKSFGGREYKAEDRVAISMFGALMKAIYEKDIVRAKEIEGIITKGQTWQSLNYGGYAIGVEYLSLFIEQRDHTGPLRQLVSTRPVNARTGKFGLESNIGTVTWGKPGAKKGATRVKGTTVSWTLAEANILVVVEDALLDWALFDYGSYITRSMSRAMAKSEWEKFITGTGSDQPTGLANASITQTAAAAATNVFSDINAGFFALEMEYRNNAAWILRDNNLEMISNLKDSQNRPIVNDIILYETGRAVPTIKGKPYFVNNNIVQTTAATPRNKVYFGDWSYYYIFENQDIRVSASQEATVEDESGSTINLWQENKTAFKMWQLLDAKLADVRAAAYMSNVS